MLCKKSEFAKKAGCSKANISKMIKRGCLIVRQNGKIDTENEVNKNYLEKRCRRMNKIEVSDFLNNLIKFFQSQEFKIIVNRLFFETYPDSLPNEGKTRAKRPKNIFDMA